MRISYKKYVKLFFKVLDQGKSLQLLPGDIGGGGILKKVIDGDKGGRRL